MAQFADRPRLLPEDVLESFKHEIASELGLTSQIQQKGWAEMTTRDAGRIGGHIGGPMVRVLIRRAEQAIAQGARIP